ncbi:ligase-associated DNA damage response endonuclease PdeM [Roseobacter sp. YSTF-M11]|uniref:Ligase-associated DNA damage response endonuclease PdeM n=1 Tax=Roseobacter insulae TaxID=2859783 RepID=A0A9X1FUM4_9RHOB|nr:ligase-associated DNA damage response endonuclease PdeM [Roseobacter insulae]MBW4707642.1 ligase-associated DNA damage response endonuclease PdeM [Roseobacter insulae]
MNSHDFSFAGASLKALGSGALWWPDEALLCVSDLHLGKSERVARRSGQSLPPYETRDTLNRLSADLAATNARVVICLGDSFDDLAAASALPEEERLWITRLQAGRRWIWIEGNHDPGPIGFGGDHVQDTVIGPLTFRHISHPAATAEVSGHYHPKAHVQARGRRISRPAFLCDDSRLILPAFGTYTGGLRSDDAALARLMDPKALAILTGPVPTCVPMPRQK